MIVISKIEKNNKYWSWTDNSLNIFLEDLLKKHILGFLNTFSDEYCLQDIDIKIFRPIRSTPTGSRFSNSKSSKSNEKPNTKIFFKKFELYFASNIKLPSLVGLGNSINIGYGTTYRK